LLRPVDSLRPAAVTFDLWYTLAYLEPADQDRYFDRQIDIATAAIDRLPDATADPSSGSEAVREAVVREVTAAAAASSEGTSISCAQQFERAARISGKSPDSTEYVAELGELVARTPFRAVPHSLSAVRALHEAGFRTGLVSNTVGEPGRSLRATLGRLGFSDYLDVYSFSDELPWTKPNPAIFREVLQRLGTLPERSLHVGDSWSDIEGARRAHFRAGILFTGHPRYSDRYRHYTLDRSGAAPTSDFTIVELRELPDLVDRLLPGRSNASGRPPV
jgi:FMN phosphatase YigB (HAD superfamily)